ncbi:MAG: glycogen debranching N-terminal domain-containing protein, partial [Nitrospinota bacterium]
MANESKLRERLLPELDEYYIFESALSAPVSKLHLKHGEAFLVCDRRGDFPRRFKGEFGFYLEGTRYISSMEVFLFGQRPVILDSVITEDGCQVVVELANAELKLPDGMLLQRHSVLIRRRISVYRDRCYQSIWVRNFAAQPVPIVLSIALGFDFADIFDVRSQTKPRRGKLSCEVESPTEVRALYDGMDRLRRSSLVRFQDPPHELTPKRARYRFMLQPQEGRELMLSMGPEESFADGPQALPQAAECLSREAEAWQRGCTSFSLSDELFNKAIERAVYDLHLLKCETSEGNFFSAGVPWFVAPFGRDGLITAIETLILKPSLSRDILAFLKRHQGCKREDFTEEEPGKILHEYRKGELANLRRIPFIPYYGSVDATPLFLITLEAYIKWTGDLAFLRECWPSARAALAWMDRYGDIDGDGFVEYARRSSKGLQNQGWRDSFDSVFHADGKLAEPPIALAEAQAYVYAAKEAMSRLASCMGDEALAAGLKEQASQLRERFNRDFWWPEEDYFYLALDGEKRPCRVLTSNPAHGLWCEIIEPDKAEAVARRLMEEEFFSGWGIRTLSVRSPCYNPLSYHNGSVWPHDNALIALGLRRYGFIEQMERVVSGIFEATRFLEDQRLPELFGGFSRAPRRGPTPYPLACRPQAWAAGALFLLLQALLGIEADMLHDRLIFKEPHLPSW